MYTEDRLNTWEKYKEKDIFPEDMELLAKKFLFGLMYTPISSRLVRVTHPKSEFLLKAHRTEVHVWVGSKKSRYTTRVDLYSYAPGVTEYPEICRSTRWEYFKFHPDDEK